MKVFLSYSSRDRELGLEVASVLRKAEHDVQDAWSISFPGELLSYVSSSIRTADLVIAILTTENPNVFYELGIAHGAGKPVLLAAPTTDRIPFDVAAVPYVQLSGEAARDSETIVRRFSQMAVSLPRASLGPQSLPAGFPLAIENPDDMESLTYAEFETLVAKIYEGFGYDVERTESASDGGADLIVRKWERGLGRIAGVIQVKKYNRHSHVSVEAVRQLAHAVRSAEITDGISFGVLVSTSGFTHAAQQLSRTSRNIHLYTIENLVEMLKKHRGENESPYPAPV